MLSQRFTTFFFSSINWLIKWEIQRLHMSSRFWPTRVDDSVTYRNLKKMKTIFSVETSSGGGWLHGNIQASVCVSRMWWDIRVYSREQVSHSALTTGISQRGPLILPECSDGSLVIWDRTFYLIHNLLFSFLFLFLFLVLFLLLKILGHKKYKAYVIVRVFQE